MKTILSILMILTFSVSYGQNLRKLKVFTTETFDPRSSITVESKPYDPLRATDVLKNSLVMSGFKVISERVAKEKFEIKNKGNLNDTSFNQDISAGSTTYIKSVYIITFSYDYRLDMGCGGQVMSDLNGQIVDLANDGEIVATFSFSQNSFEGKCTSTVMEAIAKFLKEKKKAIN